MANKAFYKHSKNEIKKIESFIKQISNVIFDIYIYLNRLYEGKLIQNTLSYITYKMKEGNKNDNQNLNYSYFNCESLEQLINLKSNKIRTKYNK